MSSQLNPTWEQRTRVLGSREERQVCARVPKWKDAGFPGPSAGGCASKLHSVVGWTLPFLELVPGPVPLSAEGRCSGKSSAGAYFLEVLNGFSHERSWILGGGFCGSEAGWGVGSGCRGSPPRCWAEAAAVGAVAGRSLGAAGCCREEDHLGLAAFLLVDLCGDDGRGHSSQALLTGIPKAQVHLSPRFPLLRLFFFKLSLAMSFPEGICLWHELWVGFFGVQELLWRQLVQSRLQHVAGDSCRCARKGMDVFGCQAALRVRVRVRVRGHRGGAVGGARIDGHPGVDSLSGKSDIFLRLG